VSVTYYAVLGVDEDATQSEIKAAYRSQAFRWHPDKHQGSKESEERFKYIAEAYSVLSDPERRTSYDHAIHRGTGGFASHETHHNAYDAEAIFFQEMVDLAYQLTANNIPWSRIASALVERGCPLDVAQAIAKNAEEQRKTAVREDAHSLLLQALAWFTGGVLTGVVNYWADEPDFNRITYAILLFSGINILRALWFLASGRVPAPKEE